MYDQEIEALRCGRAIALAALAAVAAALLAMSPMLLASPALILIAAIVGFGLAFAHALVLGLPAYLLLRRYWRLRWWNATVAGGLIAVVPAAQFFGLGGEFRELNWLASFGAVGGFSFWLSMRFNTASRSGEQVG